MRLRDAVLITEYDLQVSSHVHWKVKVESDIVCLDHRGPLQGYIAYCSETLAEGCGLTEADALESFITNAFPAPVQAQAPVPAATALPPAAPATNVRTFPLRGRFLEQAITGDRS